MANTAGTMGGPAAGTREDLASEMANLKSDLRKVKDDIRSIADALMSQGRSSAANVRDRVQERLESSVETVQEYFEQRPITSLLVVLGVGLVIGKLLNSK